MGIGGENQEAPGGSPAAHPRKQIDLKVCLQDSPDFRLQLLEHEQDINDLELKLEKVVQSCDRMVGTGQSYTEACRVFSTSLRELASHFKDDEVVAVSLRRFHEALTELQSYYRILFDQAQRSVQNALRGFLMGDLRKVKDMKKSFDKVSDEMNSAINRNAHAPRNKPQEADEASLHLANMEAEFSHSAIDYGYQLNTIGTVKGHQILDNLLSYMRAQFTFFHQGYDLLKEFDPFMRQVATEVDDLRKGAEADIRDMDSRHSLVTPRHLPDGSPDEPLHPMDNPSVQIEMCGYLFKRGSGAFKMWSRRWFILKDNKLVYQSESKEEEVATVAEDLRICTVKWVHDIERRFCFEVVTPSRSCMLQADSDALRKKWTAYLEAGVARALRISASNRKKEDQHEFRKRSESVSRKSASPTQGSDNSPRGLKKRRDLNSVLSLTSNYSLGLDFLDVPGNDRCADCGNKSPKWASINLGIMLCIECSGIHRSLGVHISKVRSITLDDWELETQKIMCALGNARVNAIYEYDIPEHIRKPTPTTSRSDRETFIRTKYVQHAFVHPHPNFERPEIPHPRPIPPSHLLSPTSKSPRPKRSASPTLHPRLPKVTIPRPASLASGLDYSESPRGSEYDVSRDFTMSVGPGVGSSSGLGDRSSTTLLELAENFKKLEKSGKLKNWNFGKSVKAAKHRASFSLSKFGRSYSGIRKGKQGSGTSSASSSPKVPKRRNELAVHSDDEDSDTMISSSTPLLHSQSATTLSPPPKPPRTFKTSQLDLESALKQHPDDGTRQQGHLPGLESDEDFTSGVLSAIKEMGSVCQQNPIDKELTPEGETKKPQENGEVPSAAVMANGDISMGRLTGAVLNPQPCEEQLEAVGESVKEASSLSRTESVRSEPLITFKVTSSPETEGGGSVPLTEAVGEASPSEAHEEERRAEKEKCPEGDEEDTPMVMRRRKGGSVDFRTPQPASSFPMATLGVEGDTTTSEIRILFEEDKRMSIMSVASTEWFSLSDSDDESSEHSSSQRASTPASLEFRESVSSPSQMECSGPRHSSSATSECYSTPPSSPPLILQLDDTPSTLVKPDTQEEEGESVLLPEEAKEIEAADGVDGAINGQLEVKGQLENGGMIAEGETCDDETTTPHGSLPATPRRLFQPKKGDRPLSAPIKKDQFEVIASLRRSPRPADQGSSSTHSPARRIHSSPLQQRKAKRSITVTDQHHLDMLEARDSVSDLFPNLSKDDNFDTEFGKYSSHPGSRPADRPADTQSLVSSFSAQDFQDIFGTPVVPTLKVEVAAVDTTIRDSDEVAQSNEHLNDGNEADSSSVGEELDPVFRDVGTPSSFGSRMSTPEVLEPVVIPDTTTPDQFLYSSASAGDLPGILCAIAHGGNVNTVRNDDEGRCPLLVAIDSANSVTVEFLFQNGGKINIASDVKGRGPLHHAVLNEDAGLVVQLLKRGAKPAPRDLEGKEPLDVALERENGDIVMLLRVAKLKSESFDDQLQNQVLEEQVAEVYKDFQVAALVDPERMKRRSYTSSESVGSRDSK